jgi:hypothetical protein
MKDEGPFGEYTGYRSEERRPRPVVRVKHPVTEGLLRTLNERFANICVDRGCFRASGPLPEEENEPELAEIARLCARRTYESGAEISSPGMPAGDVFMLEGGNDAVQIEVAVFEHWAMFYSS